MILVCPSCDTRYFADDSAVGKEGRRVRVYEVGVAYAGRTYEEGKKIGWKDAVSAIVQIIRFRFSD